MIFFRKQQVPNREGLGIRTFLGYDRQDRCPTGAFRDMENLSSDRFPLLSPRKKRGLTAELEKGLGLAGKEKLAWVDGEKLFWDGQEVPGIRLSADGEKQLVSMGAYLILFPDGVYWNTADPEDRGTLANRMEFQLEGGTSIRYALCTEDGTEFPAYYIRPAEPEHPEDGAVWEDTSSDPPQFCRYVAEAGAWERLGEIYTRMEFRKNLDGFRVGDCVHISGCAVSDGIKEWTAEEDGMVILEMPEPNIIRVAGAMFPKTMTQWTGTVVLERKVPDMDFVTECGNRLWGCKYGTVDGRTVNEIYACALGDFRNWNRFQGLSTDSYCASRGSDGPWTGAVTHMNCPLFFKEDVMEKVYPDPGGAHQIITLGCRGVQAGSHKSLCAVNGILYYKSGEGICAYDGSLPVKVSQALGREAYRNAAAGALGDKYYISMEDSSGQSHLFTLDTGRNLWHREDCTRIVRFAGAGGELYGLDDRGRIWSMTGVCGVPEDRIAWMAETGPLGLELEEVQTLSRIRLRLEPEEGSDVDLWVEYNSDGRWEHKAHAEGTGLRTLVIPVLPRRCDHLRLRICGRGDCRVYSMTLIREEGSDLL